MFTGITTDQLTVAAVALGMLFVPAVMLWLLEWTKHRR